ncbi:MAG TPA: glycosyltransferase family 2 protein [Caldilineaceae bacterium]|nr:glycosyltransferase family 2 protein [Caldilineaceae bacterium]
MNLAVAVVSYNTRDLLRRCLESVFATPLPPGARLEVVVVDNASRDGSAQMVAETFPTATLIASLANLGFTGGNNLALHRLGFPVAPPPVAPPALTTPAVQQPPDAVLLLNPDAELQGDALLQMARFLVSAPRAGACGAHLRYPNGDFQHGAFRFPTLAQVALDFFPLTGLRGAQRLHNSRLNGRYPAWRWQGATPFRVDFVLGAALMVKGDAIHQVGGLDDGFFMYCEEMDWCLRLAEAGWEVYAVPTAQVVHHEAQSSRQGRWDAYERLWRSRLRFYRKHAARYPAGYLQAVRALIRLGAAWQAYRARRRFAAGAASGVETARALAAYATIARL